jgi:hypothetical protein
MNGIGLDVGLEETCRMALCGLVGRLSYSYLSKGPIEDWVLKHWKRFWVMSQRYSILPKGGLGLCAGLWRMCPY